MSQEYEITGVQKDFGSKYFTMTLKNHPEGKITFRHGRLEAIETEELWNYVINHGYIGMVVTLDEHDEPFLLRKPGRPPNMTWREEAEHLLSVIE